MNDHLKLGLARHTDFFHQVQIENALADSFADIHDALTCLTEDVRLVEREINDVLFGERTGGVRT
jgi:hypothetical protein